MKIKLTRTITEEVELDVEFPFFRRCDNVYYAIYSQEKGIKLCKDNAFRSWTVNVMSEYEIKDKILHDESNLMFGYVEISENLFNSVKQEFLDRL
jgi:hypothetical protein